MVRGGSGMRKGSMELGIQVIVILVIAMVILGLGIGFIRGFFSKGTESLSGAFDLVDLKVKPTYDEPFVLEKGKTIRVKAGDSATLKVGVYNTKASTATDVKIFITQCDPSYNTDADHSGIDVPIIEGISQTIDPSKSVGFVTTIIAKQQKTDYSLSGAPLKDAVQGTYICELAACEDNVASPKDCATKVASMQVTLEIKG